MAMQNLASTSSNGDHAAKTLIATQSASGQILACSVPSATTLALITPWLPFGKNWRKPATPQLGPPVRFNILTVAIEPSDATATPHSDRLEASGNDQEASKNRPACRSVEPDSTLSPPRGVRHCLPRECNSLTHHFTIAGLDGYIIVCLFPDGQPGEIFINIAKQGSTLGGLMSSFAKAVSIGLQFGAPLKLFCDEFSHTCFEPSGWSSNPDIGFAKSIVDYISRWCQSRFVDGRAGPNPW
jgi:hypothetical protein